MKNVLICETIVSRNIINFTEVNAEKRKIEKEKGALYGQTGGGAEERKNVRSKLQSSAERNVFN